MRVIVMNEASPAAIQRCYAYLHEHHAEIVARREAKAREEAAEMQREGTEGQEQEDRAIVA